MPRERWNPEKPTPKEKEDRKLNVHPEPQLDHFNGRAVESVEAKSDEPWDWHIKLQGDVLIRNTDGRRTTPPRHIVGLALCATVISEVDTRLVFGIPTPDGVANRQDIVLTPTQYSISTPDHDEAYPQRAPELEALMPAAYAQPGETGVEEPLDHPVMTDEEAAESTSQD